MKKVRKEKEYRKFAADTYGMPLFTMALLDIPEPDPGKKDFRKKEMTEARKFLRRDVNLVPRLMKYLDKQE